MKSQKPRPWKKPFLKGLLLLAVPKAARVVMLV